MARIRWLGAAGLEITSGEETLLIDPYLSRVSKWETLAKPLCPNLKLIHDYLTALTGKVGGVLVGHTHSDHVLDVPAILNRTQARAYGSRSLGNLMSAYALEGRTTVVETGTSYPIGTFEAVPIASQHGRAILGMVPLPGEIEGGLEPPLRVGKYRNGQNLLWHVTVAGRRYLHMGSANFIASELCETKVEVLFVCAVGRQHIPNFTRTMLELMKPEVVVPFHYDDISVPLTKGRPPRHVPGVRLEQFADEIMKMAPDVKVIIPEPFTLMEI